MKIIIWIITTIVLAIPNFAQDNCWTIYNDVIPVFNPVGSPVAINTYGWNYVSAHSIEFERDSLYNNWDIYNGYKHKNAFNGFSDSTKYWNLDTVAGNLELYLFDDSATVDILGSFNYGYVEIKLKLPVDNTICSSFWNFGGGTSLHYRELDFFETVNTEMLFNVYHRYYDTTSMYGGQLKMNMSLFNENDWYIWGVEWLPKSYRLYINHNLVGEFNADSDCTEDYFAPINKWRLWITNWESNEGPTGTFPKTLTADYIRFYSLDLTNMNNHFYDYVSNYD